MTDETPTTAAPTEPTPHKFTARQRKFIAEYAACLNGSEAARRAGYTGEANRISYQLMSNIDIKAAVDKKISENLMSADEALTRMQFQATGDISVFFKIVEEWTFYPLPTYEVIDAKEVVDDTDPKNPKTKTSYWVKHVVIDMDKVIDPRYSHLLDEFSDSPKDGISIKMPSKQGALDKILRAHGRYTDNVKLSGTLTWKDVLESVKDDDNPPDAG